MNKTYVFEGFLNHGDGKLDSLWNWSEDVGFVSPDSHLFYFIDDCNIIVNEHEDVKGVSYLYVSTDKPLRFALRCVRDALFMHGYDFYVHPRYEVRVVKDGGFLKISKRFFRDPLNLLV